MNIRLIVLRTNNQQSLADFYTLLGLTFDYHQHGNTPFHYAAIIGQTVLEIYPLTKSQTEADKNLRLGFGLDNFDQTITTLRELSIPFLSAPIETEFGMMAIITDPDGRKIELYKN